jgi:hypothetical protein
MSQQQQQDGARQVLRRLRRVLDSNRRYLCDPKASRVNPHRSRVLSNLEALGICRELTFLRV